MSMSRPHERPRSRHQYHVWATTVIKRVLQYTYAPISQTQRRRRSSEMTMEELTFKIYKK
eukprot:5231390-Pleurochrysis_carterae.AAC.9